MTVFLDAETANQRIEKQGALIEALRAFYFSVFGPGDPEEHLKAIEQAEKDLEGFDAQILG